MRTLIAEWKYPIALSFAACVAILAWAQDSPGSKPIAKDTAPLSVEAFNEKMPIGYLGHPLGTVVRVKGATVDGDTLRSKYYAGAILLRVEEVNGKKLKKPVDFRFPHDPDTKKPKPEQRFDYYVHEQGSFHGGVKKPKELIDLMGPGANVIGIAQPSFHYDGALTIHMDMTAKK
jgi:hypothetical protein